MLQKKGPCVCNTLVYTMLQVKLQRRCTGSARVGAEILHNAKVQFVLLTKIALKSPAISSLFSRL